VARRYTEIDGEGAFWAVAGFVASVVVGVALRPLRSSPGWRTWWSSTSSWWP
jgi:hypothetical protein